MQSLEVSGAVRTHMWVVRRQRVKVPWDMTHCSFGIQIQSFRVIANFSLLLVRSRCRVSPKRLCVLTKLHGVTSQSC